MGVEGNLGALMFLGTGYLEPLFPRKPQKRFASYEIKQWPRELTKGEECGTLRSPSTPGRPSQNQDTRCPVGKKKNAGTS